MHPCTYTAQHPDIFPNFVFVFLPFWSSVACGGEIIESQTGTIDCFGWVHVVHKDQSSLCQSGENEFFYTDTVNVVRVCQVSKHRKHLLHELLPAEPPQHWGVHKRHQASGGFVEHRSRSSALKVRYVNLLLSSKTWRTKRSNSRNVCLPFPFYRRLIDVRDCHESTDYGLKDHHLRAFKKAFSSQAPEYTGSAQKVRQLFGHFVFLLYLLILMYCFKSLCFSFRTLMNS